jgi:hypothetical protein
MQTYRVPVRAVLTVAALAVALSALAQTAAPQPRTDPLAKRRYQMKMMEGVLVGAVRHGAEQVGQQLQPQMVLMSGLARARGFLLESYGVFFDVEIPAMRESVVWTMRTLEQDMAATRRTLEQLRRTAQNVNDPQMKAALDQGLRLLEAQVAPGRRQTRADTRTVAGADLAEPVSQQTPSAQAPAQQPVAQAPVAEMQDPNVLYTEAVKAAIIDAMLDHGSPLAIQPDEWLTVAARDGEGPLTPVENYDAVTFIFRIKGSDLSAFRADRITREEAQKRVEVRQF